MHERGKFGRITDLKDGLQIGLINKSSLLLGHVETYKAEEDPVQVTLICVEFESKTTGITNAVSRALLSCYSRESTKERSLLSNFAEKSRTGELAEVMFDFKVSKCTCSLGMDDPGE
jgi:hypothetical protein